MGFFKAPELFYRSYTHLHTSQLLHAMTGLLCDMTNSEYGWDVSIQRPVSELC